MPYASCLASCSVVGSCSSSQLAFPVVLCLMQLSLSEVLGFCTLIHPVHICTELWDSLSGLVHSGTACLASQAPDGQLHSGMACLACDWLPYDRCPSKYFYCKTDYCCNCLDGQLNYQASAHWLIDGATMY